jgi:hypothetical protein
VVAHGGDASSVNVGGFDVGSDSFVQSAGASYRQVVDLTSLGQSQALSWFIAPAGQHGRQPSVGLVRQRAEPVADRRVLAHGVGGLHGAAGDDNAGTQRGSSGRAVGPVAKHPTTLGSVAHAGRTLRGDGALSL